MADRYEVLVRVVSQKGKCVQEHKVGEKWVLGTKTPQGICISAFDTLLSSARVLMFGGSFPWESDPYMTTIACSDSENPVVFELRRLPKKAAATKKPAARKKVTAKKATAKKKV
ncbi:MAG: TIGR04076 family protein [Chloroflexota bacterium]|nr:TIGR04076 family protein [Chloroflexota bacterium]